MILVSIIVVWKVGWVLQQGVWARALVYVEAVFQTANS